MVHRVALSVGSIQLYGCCRKAATSTLQLGTGVVIPSWGGWQKDQQAWAQKVHLQAKQDPTAFHLSAQQPQGLKQAASIDVGRNPQQSCVHKAGDQ